MELPFILASKPIFEVNTPFKVQISLTSSCSGGLGLLISECLLKWGNMSSSPAIREDQEKWGLYHKNIANCEHSAQRAQFCLGCSVGQAEEMAGQEEQMAWAKVEEMTEQVPPGEYDTSVSLRWSVV